MKANGRQQVNPSDLVIMMASNISEKPADGAPVAKGMTAEQAAQSGTEHGTQQALFIALTNMAKQHHATMPELREIVRWIHAVANGGERDVVTAGRLKAEGVRSGVWDIFVPVARKGFHGLYIEMKKPILMNKKKPGNGMSDNQKKFGLFVHAQGYKTALCYTWYDALKVIMDYLDVP